MVRQLRSEEAGITIADAVVSVRMKRGMDAAMGMVMGMKAGMIMNWRMDTVMNPKSDSDIGMSILGILWEKVPRTLITMGRNMATTMKKVTTVKAVTTMKIVPTVKTAIAMSTRRIA